MATVNHTSDEFAYSSAQLTWRPRIDGDVVVQDPLISVSEKAFADVSCVSKICVLELKNSVPSILDSNHYRGRR
jgi:hypothetical protein